MKHLRSGYTTGCCAAAAAKGAALLLRDGRVADSVELTLPAGETVRFTLESASLSRDAAVCSVIKDAGDDPDVTNGAEVLATVRLTGAGQGTGIIIQGGTGIGSVTKPGLAVAVGQWAINPVPRRMIGQAVREIIPDAGVEVTISIPDGEQRALKTLNARLGIIGGLSILGTTGIVRPVSAQAWTDTIDSALDVAKACGCPTVALATGRASELAAMRYLPELPEEAFIMMGDHIAHALRSCSRRGYLQPALVCQFAKLVKIACGHPNTHAAASELDLDQLRGWIHAAQLSPAVQALADSCHTARELAITSGYDPQLMQLVSRHACAASRLHAPVLSPQILVCSYDQRIVCCHPE